jgi:hypothetical protein
MADEQTSPAQEDEVSAKGVLHEVEHVIDEGADDVEHAVGEVVDHAREEWDRANGILRTYLEKTFSVLKGDIEHIDPEVWDTLSKDLQLMVNLALKKLDDAETVLHAL